MSRPCWITILLLSVTLGTTAAHAQNAKEAIPPKTAQAWTLDEATGRFALYPEDVYLQFVVMQLALNENKVKDISTMIEQTHW